MGDNAKIAAGAAAAGGVVLLLWFLLRNKSKPAKKDVSKPKPNKAGGDYQPKAEFIKKTEDKSTSVQEASSFEEKVKTSHLDSAKEQLDSTKNEVESSAATLVPAVENVVESSTQPELLAENVKDSDIQADHGISLSDIKKTEHSSDESSYDVIEDEAAGDIAKTEDIKDEIETDDILNNEQAASTKINDNLQKEKSEEHSQPESFQDSNDTSMVVVDDILEQSNTSYYTTADESGDIVSSEKPTGLTIPESEDKEEPRESTSSESYGHEKTLSTSLADQSVIFVGEEKIDDSVIYMGEEKPDQKELAMSVDLSSWQKTEEIAGDVENSGEVEMGSWLQVTEESAKEAENESQQQGIVMGSGDPESVITEADVSDILAKMPSEERMTEVLTACQNNPASVNKDDLDVLAAILSRGTSSALEASVLDSLVRVSAFTQHNVNICDCGFPDMITSLTMESCQQVIQEDLGSKTRLGQLCQVITNFSLDPKTMADMESVVPALINVACLESATEVLQLALLQPLTNFSSTSAFLHHFHRMVQTLLSLLESGSSATRVKVLKVLVNLSLDVDMLPHLLGARAPDNLLDLLDVPTPNDVILRAVTFLANVEESLYNSPRAPLALPVEEKAESPLTLHVALKGVEGSPQLRNKVFRLTRHEDEDVVFQASRLYKIITSPPK